MTGREWIVDAYGCDPDALKDGTRLRALFAHMIDALQLKPLGEARWHEFPAPGGWTGFCLLEESHLSCHTFPEHHSMCLNLFCCRPRPEYNYVMRLGQQFGAETVRVRRMERPYGTLEPAA
jgi:S-adenosylmethionine decarboxylase